LYFSVLAGGNFSCSKPNSEMVEIEQCFLGA